MRTYGELEKEFARYVRTGRYRSTLVDFSAAGVTRSASVTPIDRAELLYRLGDLLARIDSGKEKQAEKHFREAIKIDPSHAASHAGLGFLRDRDGRRDKATPYYEKALALDPDDYMTAFLYAINLSRVALGEDLALTPIRDEPPANLVRSRELFRRSLALRPGLAEAYAGLGATYIVEADDFQDGIDALETARRLLPSRMDIVFHLMQLYARGDRRDEAQRLMDDVFSRHADPARIAMARDMLLQADMMRAHRMIEEGRHEEGIAALEELRATSTSPKMQATIEAEIAQVQSWLKNSDEIDAHNRQVALYNEAVRKANDQDLAGAAAILEKLVPDIQNDTLREQARDLLRRIEEAMGE
jgi:tetratricopeptide (TPR) repeat protein